MSNPNRDKKEYTLDEIARELGVHKTTVSRVISGKGRISPQTRERVQAFIDAHGFRPNATARSLANSRPYNIGILNFRDAGMMESSFFIRCVTGICAAASEHDYDVLMVDGTEDELDSLRRVMDDRKVEGVIITRSVADSRAVRLLREYDLPFVVIGPGEPGVLSVDNDNTAACRELTATIVSRCHIKKPALLGGKTEHLVTQSRLKGFLEGCALCGVDPEPELILMDAENKSIESIADRLVRMGADAVFCMDELLCSLLIMHLKSHNVSVPDTLKIACFYDSAILEYMVPSVTGIRFDATALGRRACEKLIKSIEGMPVDNEVLNKYSIILRASTE